MPVCPQLPLSTEERQRLDMYRSAVIPTLEAALNRYAPPEWKAYYAAALAYLRDESLEHAPEENPGNMVFIEARLTPTGIQMTTRKSAT